MKNNVPPGVFAGIIAVAVILLVVFAYRAYTGPSATAAKVGPEARRMGRDVSTDAEKAEQKRWQQEHPSGYAR